MERELLIEIGVEELPAGWMPGLTRQVAERLEGSCARSGSRRWRRSRATARRGA
jgi:glycyl-tRNA synthetase beta subunit